MQAQEIDKTLESFRLQPGTYGSFDVCHHRLGQCVGHSDDFVYCRRRRGRPGHWSGVTRFFVELRIRCIDRFVPALQGGDWVEAAGVAGTIVEVQILTTVFRTGDNKSIIVPNGQVMNSVIINYSANDQRRVDMVVGVSYDDDLDKVRATLEDLIAADDRILDDPACTIAVAELADSSVNFVVRPWVKSGDYSGRQVST